MDVAIDETRQQKCALQVDTAGARPISAISPFSMRISPASKTPRSTS